MITNGFKNLMKQVLSSGGTSQGLLPITDVSGTTRYLADYTAYPYTVTTNFATTAAGAGISVGSGNSASTENTYQLANTITSGLSGTVTVSKTVDVNNNSTIELELSLSNTSGSDITIAEIGYKQEFSASSTQSGTSTDDYVFLIDRTVLSSPATIVAGGSAVITYSLTTKFGASGGVTDVEVDGVSVVTGGVAEIDLTGKQDTLIAGTNITIAADGKTISASGGTTVVANPSGTATGDLNSVQIGSTIYDIPSSGGGTTVIPNPVGTPTDDLTTIQIGSTVYDIPGGGGSGGVRYRQELIYDTPISSAGNITVSDFSDADSLTFVIGIYVSGDDYQTFINEIPMAEFRTGEKVFIGGTLTTTEGNTWSKFAGVKYVNDTTIQIVDIGGHYWSQTGYLYRIYKNIYAAGQYSHVYSTNPHIVGKWIDGSAIWECTYDFGSDVTVSTNWSATTIPNTDMDMCIRCEAMSSYGTNKPNIEADLKDSGGYVKLAADGVSNNVRYLTLQYTMST